MTAPSVLLTVDEARDLFGASAIALVDALDCSPGRLNRLLHAKGTTKGLAGDARGAVKAHRAVVRQVVTSGNAWVLEEQIEGALSYAGCRTELETATLAA